MARLARLSVPGWPHLILQFGHNRQAVFRDDVDRRLYVDLLRQAALASGTAIHAYALFDNEVRLLVTPTKADGPSRTMQSVGRGYGASFNRRHGHVGSVWEGRFRATVIDPERHLLDCMRYVEGLGSPGTLSSDNTGWSSAAHHLGERPDDLISDHLAFWSLGNTPFEREASYRDLSQHALTSENFAQILDAAMKGWPLGSPRFLNELSSLTDRRLAPMPRGRPRKAG